MPKAIITCACCGRSRAHRARRLCATCHAKHSTQEET